MDGLTTILLGAGSGLLWGTADFFGGLQSRRLPALAVVIWSQIVGAALLLGIVLISGRHPDRSELLWGTLAGVSGGFALLCFYRGLAVGAMSIVAPISGCGALVPVLYSFVTGHAPSPTADVGMVLALAGIVVVSIHSGSDANPSGRPRQAILLAVLSALGFGAFYVLLQHGGSSAQSSIWPIVGVRIGSLGLLFSIALAGRRRIPWPGRGAPIVACVGLVDATSNILWLLAATRGNLGVAAVLGSLYPVATVILGRLVLSERLSQIQQAGVVLALAGVALVGI